MPEHSDFFLNNDHRVVKSAKDDESFPCLTEYVPVR